ncbi:MAG: SRPBCC domain-containing protein [Bacteroidetes bacterium]|nr:SRPBCC domain-containing protein [Bacteroidota bacterium]
MMSTNDIPCAITDGETILATVNIPASPERLYQALTTKEMETWWGEDGIYHVRNWRSDARAGSEWTLDVMLPDGTALPASGEFLLVDEPNKFVITRRYDWDAPILGRTVTTVTYLLDKTEHGTRVTVRHDGFKGYAQAAYEHADGWQRFLGWLRRYFVH